MFQVKRDSWHYRMYRFGNPYMVYDFCSYSRGVLWGLFFFTLIAAVGIGCAGVMLLGAYELVLVATGALAIEFADFGQLFVVTVFAGSMVAITIFIMRADFSKPSRKSNRPPGFITTWWQSIKQKMCSPVEMEH